MPIRPGFGRVPLIGAAAAGAVLIAVAAVVVIGLTRPDASKPDAGPVGPQVATTTTVDPNPNTDPNLNPTADPNLNPSTDPNLNPTADPNLNPNTGPTLDPTAGPTAVDPAAPAAEVASSAQAALAELGRLSGEGRAQVTFRGQFAAQLASKYPGIVDPMQTTASGSHTFTAADILDEHRRLNADHAGPDHPVILLKSTDYGKRQKVGTHFLWVTFAIGDFPDRQSVLTWCATQFATLTGDERENQCAVRRLDPGR